MDIYTAYRLIKRIENDNKDYMEISKQANQANQANQSNKANQANQSNLKDNIEVIIKDSCSFCGQNTYWCQCGSKEYLSKINESNGFSSTKVSTMVRTVSWKRR